jgi:hypothetical protein
MIEEQEYGVVDGVEGELNAYDGRLFECVQGMDVYQPNDWFLWGLVSVYEFDEVAAAVARVAGIVAQVAEPADVSALEFDEVEGWLGVWGGGCEPQGFTAPVFNQEAAPCLDGFPYRLFTADDFIFAHMGIIPDFV